MAPSWSLLISLEAALLQYESDACMSLRGAFANSVAACTAWPVLTWRVCVQEPGRLFCPHCWHCWPCLQTDVS